MHAEVPAEARRHPPQSTSAGQVSSYDYVDKDLERTSVVGAVFGNLEANSYENTMNLGHGADLQGSKVRGMAAYNPKFKHGVKNTVNVLGMILHAQMLGHNSTMKRH